VENDLIAERNLWTRDELNLALNLYLKPPFGKLHSGMHMATGTAYTIKYCPAKPKPFSFLLIFALPVYLNSFVVPKTRTDWRLNKINSNVANDVKAAKALKKEGWKINHPNLPEPVP